MTKKAQEQEQKPITKNFEEMTKEELLKEVLNSEEKINALVTENETLIAENEKLLLEASQNKDSYMRNVAEFDNYKKRNAHIYTDAYNDGKSDALIKFLAIGDGILRATQMVTDEQSLKGINLLMKTFEDILKEQGITEINPVGEKFDPELSEAVSQVQDENLEEDTIKDVYQKGYKLNSKVIRYAKVSVVK